MVLRKAMLWLPLTVFLLSQSMAESAESGGPKNDHLKFKEITVAFRADAAPFSSFSDRASERNGSLELSIADFEGYIVTICHRVLREMLSSSPHFRGANLRVIEFTPSKIEGVPDKESSETIDHKDADIYCGPTSITKKRMENFNVSMPVYVTGVAVASHPPLGDVYPRYVQNCKPIVGLVNSTTALGRGLSLAANHRKFDHFSQTVSELVRDGTLPVRTNKGKIKDYCKEDLVDAGEPPKIVLFRDHKEGLAAFCRGDVLFYISDVDIISDYLSKNKESCDINLDREVLFKEHYGIFFKKKREKSKGLSEEYMRSILVYAYFNLALSRLNQEGDGLFVEAYRATFGDRPRTPELESFFRSTSYGVR